MREEEFGTSGSIIEDLYQAATGADTWAVCQSVLCSATGAIGAIFSDLQDPVSAVASDSLRTVNALYRERWHREDVFLQLALSVPPKPGLLRDDAFDDRIDRRGHPFFKDFLRPNGMGRFVAFISPPLFGARFLLMIQRALAAGDFSEGDIGAFSAIAPHVTRAMAIAGKLEVARSRDRAMLAILGKMSYGALIVGAAGRVIASNDAALRLLGDGLVVQDGRLVETFTNPRGLIDGLLRQAGADESGTSSGLLHRPSGGRPIVLQAMAPSPRLPWTIGQRHDSALLMLIDTEGQAAASGQGLVQSFGLTLAEARVAAIVGAGFSPVEAAEQLGSAAGTVRTQLKNVFNKLDLKRQSELVRLMTRLEVLGD